MKVIEPQEHGGSFYHIISNGIDITATRARCLSCRRDLPLSQFKPAHKSHKLWTKRNFVLHANCIGCMNLQFNTLLSTHPLYSPDIDRFWTLNFRSLVRSARERLILVLITKDYLLQRYLENNGRCELTGVRLTPKQGKWNKNAPSVDRIDSRGSYEEGNIQIIARAVNLMKSDMNQNDFITLCARVANYRILRDQQLLAAIDGSNE